MWSWRNPYKNTSKQEESKGGCCYGLASAAHPAGSQIFFLILNKGVKGIQLLIASGSTTVFLILHLHLNHFWQHLLTILQKGGAQLSACMIISII